MPEPSFKELQLRAQAAAKAARAARVLQLRPPAWPALRPPGEALPPPYAELHCLTHFSFQRGASSPEELVHRAWQLGYAALAITDECSVAGVVRAWQALGTLQRSQNDHGHELAPLHAERAALGVTEPLRLIYGSEFRWGPDTGLDGGTPLHEQGTLVALARDLAGWGDLCTFITRCRGAAVKGRYRLPPLAEALAALPGCERLWAPRRRLMVAEEDAHGLIAGGARPSGAEGTFGLMSALLLELHGDADDALWRHAMQQLSARTGLPLLPAGDVHMHVRARKRLHDVMTAIRVGRPVQACGFALQPNAERHLRPRARLAQWHDAASLAATLAVARRCRFTLEEVRYNYPREAVLPGLTPTQTLRRLTIEGAHERYPAARYPRVPIKIWRYVAKELKLIAECGYEMFFLTVHDIVREARRRGILCQGRGSAANSVVCWCLGITAADPEKSHPLLERFISRARKHEPPDIDVDFEHERREEVIQYIYAKYGRHRAALAATVICYRTRSALRDVGHALGLPERLIDAFAKDHHWFDESLAAHRLGELAAQLGCPLSPAQALLWLALTDQLRGTPRHLSQHVGGFVLTETPLHRLVPVEPAAMDKRQVIQWDKDDLEALGLLKVDVLALGMLTAVRRCIELVAAWRGTPFTRYDITPEDEATYDMIRRADTVGTFQIESRAQMSMLPRLKPTTFYDLVVQVAIVRPGPITGGMVHPYLHARERRRNGLPIEYERSRHDRPGESPRLAKALARTLGIPIFQEQVMELSMLAAGFSAEEADQLRRAMAAWKRKGGLAPFEQKLTEGMLANGYSAAFAARIFRQIQGFGEYGFPESHAYSFALIAYESAWLKCHEPEAFLAAMLNSQPMGFYAPAQLVQDARRHDVVVLPVDVTVSDWDCTLEAFSEPNRAAMPEGRAQAAIESEAMAGGAAAAPGAMQGLKSNRPPAPAGQALAAIKSAETKAIERLVVPADADRCADLNPPSRRTTPAPATTESREGECAHAMPARTAPRPAVRLGLSRVHGLAEAVARRIVAARARQPFASVDDLARRASLDVKALNQLAAADALQALAGHRRQQAWQGAALQATSPLLHEAPIDEAPLVLPAAPEGEDIVQDYAALGLTLRRHPLALLRPLLARWRLRTAEQLREVPHGRTVRACGIVIGRQQPGTARGTIFVTLEDETGPVNVIVWASLREDEDQRRALLRSHLLAVEGQWQRDTDSGGEVRHLVARRLRDLTPLLGRLAGLTRSRDFH